MKSFLMFVLVFTCVLHGCSSQPQEPPQNPPASPPEQLAMIGKSATDADSASKVGVRAMRQDELASCARQNVELHNAAASLSAEAADLKAESLNLVQDGKALDNDRGKINRASSQQVDAFNLRIKTHLEHLRDFNKKVDSFKVKLTANRLLINSFNTDCADRPYRVADLDLLPEDQKNAMKQGARPFDLPVYSDDENSPQPTTADPPWLLH